jgi:hypothetical protein
LTAGAGGGWAGRPGGGPATLKSISGKGFFGFLAMMLNLPGAKIVFRGLF